MKKMNETYFIKILRGRILFLFTGFLLFFSFSSYGEEAKSLFSSIVKELLVEICRFYPVLATERGIHSYDTHLASFQASEVKKYIQTLKNLRKRLKKLKLAELSLDDQIDYRLLESNLNLQIMELDQLRWWKKNPVLYVDECIEGPYYLLLREFAPLEERIKSVIGRLEEIPRVLSEAQLNIKSPPRLFCEIAKEKLFQGMEFFKDSFPMLAEKVSPPLGGELLKEMEKALEAMEDYRRKLELLSARGGNDFAMGKRLYEYQLRIGHMLDLDADELLKLGEKVMAATKSEIDSLEKLAEKEETVPEKLSPPPDFSREDLFAYYYAEMESIKSFLEKKEIVTVPPYIGRLQIVETPKFLRGIIPGIAMEPPAPFDTLSTSYFYIRPLPESFTAQERERFYEVVKERGFRGAIVHEGYPGHHLQLSIANHNPSEIRKFQQNNVLVEGWALYCEELMVEAGLYSDNKWARLGMLRGVLFRAARVVVDVKLQTGQFNFEQAVQFMREKAGCDSAFAAGEVKRYVCEPTQPMSYLIGKLLILKMKEDYQARLKGAFSLKRFHDALLREGSLPPKLIRMKLIGEL